MHRARHPILFFSRWNGIQNDLVRFHAPQATDDQGAASLRRRWYYGDVKLVSVCESPEAIAGVGSSFLTSAP